MTNTQQIERISNILGHPAMRLCLECEKSYIPMNSITAILCPYCQKEEINNLEEDHALIIEEVNHEENEV